MTKQNKTELFDPELEEREDPSVVGCLVFLVFLVLLFLLMLVANTEMFPGGT